MEKNITEGQQINGEVLKQEIINVDTSLLLQLFATENIMYDPSYYDKAMTLNDDGLMEVLSILEVNIKHNYEQQIYPSSVKNNLYRLLQIYRDKYKNEAIINKTNELRSILNTSGEDNILDALRKEFRIRFLDIMPNRQRKNYCYCYRDKIETLVNQSISYDYYFFKSLVHEDKKEFIDIQRGRYIPLTNLSNLLYEFPFILKDKTTISKLLELLYENIEISKYLRKKGLNVEGEMEDTKDASNVCIKRIKKLKLDK